MKRIVMMVLRNFFTVPYMWFKLCYYASHVDKYTKEQHYKMLSQIVARANKGGNVRILTTGQEHIPQEDGFIFYPNHQGYYDVLAIVAACPKPFSVVAKKEVGNIPFLKQVFACMRAYLMDREDVRQSMQVIMNVTKDVQSGKNFCIFAEGTRSKHGNQVGEFKAGSFKAATKAKCPIVPVALIDSFKPFDTNTTADVTVQVHFLEPIEYEQYQEMKTGEIAKLVEDRIQKKIFEEMR